MIYPIRVDVSSKDNGLRIVDTILLDPTCLPIPPSTTNENYNSYNLYSQTILQNASFFAKNLLADMEVDGINKTEKIGRIRLVNNNDLIMMVENQIQKQLKSILEKESKRKMMNSTRNINHYSKTATKKRKLSGTDEEEKAVEDKDKVHDKEDASMESTEQEVVENDTTKEEGDKDGVDKEEAGKTTDTDTKEDSKNDEENSKKQQDILKNLKTIHIRIKEDAIVYTDVIHVDTNPTLPHLSNPILLAKSLVKDMNLPSSMTNSIAVTIAEQLHGLDVKPDITGLMQKDTPKSGELAAAYFERIQVDSDIPSAWKIDDKEENLAKTHHCKAAMPQYNLNQ